MINAEINAKFLAVMSFNSTKIILKNIADHYRITPEEAYNEVTGEDAESLIDYMTGTDRDYYGLIMIQFKHNIGVNQMSNKEFNVGDIVQYNLGFTANATVLEVGKWNDGIGTKITIEWLDGKSKGKTESLGTAFLTVIKKAQTEPVVPTPNFKVGDKVAYTPPGTSVHTWIGTVLEVIPDKFKYSDEIHNGYRIGYTTESGYHDSGWMSDPNLSLAPEVSPTVKSAIEAKAELEKKILGQIQEYNKNYGVVVSDVNLRSYGTRNLNGDYYRYFNVDIEVKL